MVTSRPSHHYTAPIALQSLLIILLPYHPLIIIFTGRSGEYRVFYKTFIYLFFKTLLRASSDFGISSWAAAFKKVWKLSHSCLFSWEGNLIMFQKSQLHQVSMNFSCHVPRPRQPIQLLDKSKIFHLSGGLGSQHLFWEIFSSNPFTNHSKAKGRKAVPIFYYIGSDTV